MEKTNTFQGFINFIINEIRKHVFYPGLALDVYGHQSFSWLIVRIEIGMTTFSSLP